MAEINSQSFSVRKLIQVSKISYFRQNLKSLMGKTFLRTDGLLYLPLIEISGFTVTGF